jgi:hypothetical protein
MADLVDAANPDEVERYLSGGGVVTVGLPLAMAGYIRKLKTELANERTRADALVTAMNAELLDADTYWKSVFAAKEAITKAREAEKSG